jgi:transcriptional regulator with XRE-family HTH domain
MTGAQLRRIRQKLKLTQVQFAARLGIESNSLARLERDERRISEPLARLVRLLSRQG